MAHPQPRKRGPPVRCQVCERSFARTDSLRRHARLHTATGKKLRIVEGKFRACQRCREEHTSCSGEQPCSKCLKSRKSCVYAEPSSAPAADAQLPPKPDQPACFNSSETLQGLASTLHSIHTEESSTKSNTTVEEVELNTALNAIKIWTAFDEEENSKTQDNKTLATIPFYPVLAPLSTFLEGRISLALASHLLSQYFTTHSTDSSHPKCPYIHTFVVRRRDMLHESAPRKTHPALLSTMMWVVTLTQEVSHLFRNLDQQEQVSSFLGQLSFSLLHPDILAPAMRLEDLMSHNSYPYSWPSHVDIQTFHERKTSAYSTFDLLVAITHMSSVVSASEKKSKSLSWWRHLYNLSQNFMLTDEHESVDEQEVGTPRSGFSGVSTDQGQGQDAGSIPKEERRRLWWLLFIMDRHLSLCYNEPLFFTEILYSRILPPMKDAVWDTSRPNGLEDRYDANSRHPRLPHFLTRALRETAYHTEESFFGIFLPLMTMTGRLLERHREVNDDEHNFTPIVNGELDGRSIEGDLAWFCDCLREICVGDMSQAQFLGTDFQRSPYSPSAPDWKMPVTSSICGLYALYMLEVLYILQNSKWDPYQLVLDRDFWTSSPRFGQALSSSVAGSKFLELILERDEGLVYIPYFFGIQLLLGSLPLLGLPLRLGSNTGQNIVHALRIYLRATDACLVTLPTVYQRRFRAVLLSGIDIACGRKFDAATEVKRLLNVVSTYRWSAYGHGLATRQDKAT